MFGALAAGVACYHIASYLDLRGLLYISAGLERMILFCYPAIAVFFAWLLLNEKPSNKLYLALAIAYSGIGVFFFADLSFAGDDIYLGSALVFIASILTAWYLVSNQIYSRKMGSQRFTCIAMIGAVCSMLIHASVVDYFNDEALNFSDLSTQMYIGAAIIAVFCTLIPSFLVSAGVKIIGASQAGVVGAIGPLITIVLSNYILNEPLTYLHFIGLALVIVGMRLLK